MGPSFCTIKETISKMEKTTLRMAENNSKWNKWQRINLQNIRAAQVAQYHTHTKKYPIKKWAEDLTSHFSKDIHMVINIWQDAQHHTLLEKCKSNLQWSTTSYQSEWPSTKKSTDNKCWRGCGEKGTLLHCWWECKVIQPLWRTVWKFLKKLGLQLPYDPAILLLDIYPEETISEKDTCTPVFTEALFTIARTWKQPGCPLTDEWIRKLWYICTM